MKLIVGLGNPGKCYENTRHNIGFFFLDKYLEKRKLYINKSKFDGIYCDYIVNGEKVIFLKPQSYMNLSGVVVKKFVDYFKIPINDVLIVSDDIALTVGDYRLRATGSSGGHNGLKNIENNLSTQNFKRLRIGISNCDKKDMKDYVLGKISDEDFDIYLSMVETISNVIDDFLCVDFDKIMCKYNRKKR